MGATWTGRQKKTEIGKLVSMEEGERERERERESKITIFCRVVDYPVRLFFRGINVLVQLQFIPYTDVACSPSCYGHRKQSLFDDSFLFSFLLDLTSESCMAVV